MCKEKFIESDDTIKTLKDGGITLLKVVRLGVAGHREFKIFNCKTGYGSKKYALLCNSKCHTSDKIKLYKQIMDYEL